MTTAQIHNLNMLATAEKQLSKVKDTNSQEYKAFKSQVNYWEKLVNPPKVTPAKVTPQKVTPSKNSAVNYWTKEVASKEQEYKEKVASDKKSNPNLPYSNDTIDTGIQLQKAKEQLQKEIANPITNS
jgi:hypothetical protein